MPTKKKMEKTVNGKVHYVSVDGSSKNDGTIDSPWDLAHAFGGAVNNEGPHVHPGDTVWIRGGTYRSKEDFEITISGTAIEKISFRAYRSETVILDGSISEFTTAGNEAWEVERPISAGHNVYYSKNNFQARGLEFFGGFIKIGNSLYSLAPHKSLKYLKSPEHNGYDPGPDRDQPRPPFPRYLGPGIAQETGDSQDHRRIYIRLDNSTVKAQLGRPVPQIDDPDPRNHEIFLCKNTRFGLKITGSHLVIEGFTQINHFGSCINLETDQPGQTDVTIRNCGGRPIYFGMRCAYIDGLVLDSCKFYAHMPSEKWWVAYADIKGLDAPADQVRKLGLDLGRASNVKVINCLFDEFFDGTLASAADCEEDGSIQLPAHDIEIHRTIFNHTWDDAWQMVRDLYHINFHHNFCFGAGPSVDDTGSYSYGLKKYFGTVYIHHNVIDTTKCLVFWGRYKSPGAGMFEAIPLSSHGSLNTHIWPRKLYYNTIVTGPENRPDHFYVGWSLAGATDPDKQIIHEVYNNIFLVKDGRPGGKEFDATSGNEIYDGNVYWNYVDKIHHVVKYPWQILHVIENGISRDLHNEISTVQQLRDSPAFVNSQDYYPPGWEYSGLSVSPQLDRTYRPRTESCKKGAVNLTQSGWPGTDERYERWRGAVKPLFIQKNLRRKKSAKEKKNSK